MLKSGGPEVEDVDSISELVVTGASVRKEKLIDLKYMFPKARVFQIYTLTAAAGPVTSFNLKDSYNVFVLHNYPSSMGKPMAGFSYKVVDEATGKNLGPNEKGELFIKSRVIAKGYYNQRHPRVLDEDGWLKTGDEVYYDESYSFFMVNRLTDTFKFQDWEVSPGLIEQVLLSHPAIKDAVVVGIPDEEDVNHPFALVVLEEPNRKFNPLSIVKYVEERVHDSHRLRGGVRIVDHIPTASVSGTRKRSEVCDWVLSNRHK